MESCTLCETWSAHKAYHLGLVTEIAPALRIDGAFVPNPLVILGAHGKSGIRDAIMGSTTERVLHGCPGNSLVIRERTED